MLAIVTVPALGFGTTLVILGYGIFADGFGVQGVLRSVSVLDQKRHEVASTSARTLFAGLGPAAYELEPGGYVENIDALSTNYRRGGAHRLTYELDRGVLAGEVLPSRAQTSIVATKQGAERARLRLRERAAGGYELMPGPDFAPLPGVPFVVRDFGGEYYARDGDVLEPCSAGRARRMIDEVIASYMAMSFAHGDVHVSVGRASERVRVNDAEDQVRERLLTSRGGLPRGSYLGSFASVPWAFDHGLDVDYHRTVHLVRGELAAEDIVP